jgi:hypothetical protein
MARTTRLAAALAVAVLAAACGGSSKSSSSTGLAVPVTGVVYTEATSGATATPAAGVKVTATAGAGAVTATTLAAGGFSLNVTVPPGAQLLVTFEQAGSAKLARTFRVNSTVPISVSATMRPLKALTCDTAGGCQLDGGKLALGNLDAGTSGKARVFNPATELTAFPGSFSDSAGNLLVSGVFSALEMRTATGAALTQMPMRLNAMTGAAVQAAADLQMEVPRDTWPSVRDMTPTGDTKIVVPLYAFNETTGQWQYERDGVLVDGSGAEIPATELANIRARTYAGPIYARGQVTHFSWWNVDWPVETHGCITGRILDATGHPATGAVVSVSLASPNHNGTSQPVTVGADGKFCLESLRSEAAGEDVDGDGVTGETHQVLVRVSFGGALYEFPLRDMPTGNGTCGSSGACLALGDLTLSDATKLTAKKCTLHGHVTKDAVPQGGVAVWAFDDQVPWDFWDFTCGTGWSGCTPMASTDPDGAYTLVVPMIGSTQVTAWWTADTGLSWRWGQKTVPAPTPACPAGPFDVDLNQGFDWVTLAVSVAQGQVTWTPSLPLSMLTVTNRATGSFKWMVEANAGVAGFSSPVTYGTAPANATQLYPDPAGASPVAAPLAACDELSLFGQSLSGQVYSYSTGSCVLLGSAGALTCVPADDPVLSTTCGGTGGGPVDPGTVPTIVGTWTGDTDVSAWMQQPFSGLPTLVIGADGTYAMNFDSSGAAEVTGTYGWDADGNVIMTDTGGAQSCSTGSGTYTPELYSVAGTAYLWLFEVGADPCAGRSAMAANEGFSRTLPVAASFSPSQPRVVKFPTRR